MRHFVALINSQFNYMMKITNCLKSQDIRVLEIEILSAGYCVKLIESEAQLPCSHLYRSDIHVNNEQNVYEQGAMKPDFLLILVSSQA